MNFLPSQKDSFKNNHIAPTSQSKNFKTLLSQAYRCVKFNEFSASERFFRQALKQKPNNAEALAGLGQSLCHQHRKREGISYLRKAGDKLFKNIRKKNTSTQDLQNLASQLSFWGDIEYSSRYLLALSVIAPSSAIFQSLALDLSRINKLDDALIAAKKALKLEPQEPNIRILISLLEVKQKKFEPALARLQTLTNETLSSDTLARAYLEKGICLDKMNLYSEAFSAFKQSHLLLSNTEEALSLDQQFTFSRIEENTNGFTNAWFIERNNKFKPDGLPTPIFLLGFLRSGTTLTEQVLASHPQVFTSDESDILAETINQLKKIVEPGESSLEKLKRASAADLAELRQFFWQRIEEEHGKEALTKTYIEKNALNSISVGFINILFPDAKIIFCLRDPRDVCLSSYMQSFSLSSQTAPLLSWEGTAKFYAGVMDLWLTAKEILTIQFFELRYENAVSDFEQTFRQLFTFLEIEWDPNVEYFYQQTKHKYIATPSFSDVTKPIYQSSKARWKNYTPYFEPIMPILGRFLSSSGEKA